MSFLYFRLFFICILVLFLTIFPFPVGYELFRPSWGLLFLLYIQFRLPTAFSYFWVISLSLFLDVLSVTPLGEHLIAFSLVVGISGGRARRFKFFSPVQQMLWIFFLTFIYESVLIFIDYCCGHRVTFVRFFIPSLVTTLIWPIFSSLLETSVLRSKIR
jgi:rod shape-determining protein MreD